LLRSFTELRAKSAKLSAKNGPQGTLTLPLSADLLSAPQLEKTNRYSITHNGKNWH
jgi:hypothetical protein